MQVFWRITKLHCGIPLPNNQTVYLSYEPVQKACAALQPARIATVNGQLLDDADEDVRVCNKLSGTVS